MKDYLYIIRGGEDLSNKSPEYMEKHMKDWQTWMGGIAQAGKLVGGQPLNNEGMTLVENGSKVIDRPLSEGKELVGGYLIFKANNLAEATELGKECPGFEHGCTLEVREIAPM
ncbi:MAG: YciI family protein [Vicingaceae bacterium]